jgi:uncharacterized membrane protein
MFPAPLLTAAAEAEKSGINHWLVGAAVLLMFVVLMAALLAFGAGREHS